MMANFYVNTNGTIAVRLASIEKVYISNTGNLFSVIIRNTHSDEDTLESANTLEAAQALATPIVAALEA
jgi:hypothetical protein